MDEIIQNLLETVGISLILLFVAARLFAFLHQISI
jgi:hypothetical protein